jgi:hypothetical protein
MAATWIVLGVGLLGLISPIPAFWQISGPAHFVPFPGGYIERSVVRAPWFRMSAGWGPYTLRVKYAYQVDDREFTSDRFSIVQHRYGRKTAEGQSPKLPAELAVLVNPRDPADAVVNRKGTEAVIGTFCLAAIVVLYAVVSIAYS